MKLKKYNVIDIETDGLDINDKINWIGIHTWDDDQDEGEYIYLDARVDDLSILKELNNHITIFHNGKFDTKMLQHHTGINIRMDHDTMVLLYLISTAGELINNRGKGWLSLKNAAMRLLNAPDWDVGLDIKTSQDIDEIKDYLKGDLYWTRRLYTYCRDHIDDLDKPTYSLIMKASNVYKEIELNGLPINLDELVDVREDYEERLEDLDLQMQRYADINWNSPKQLQELLFNELGLPIMTTTATGQPSTGVEALSKLKGQHDIIDLILRRREVGKALTFLNDWENRERDGRIYAQFNLTTTVTGRTSCNSPNLQQVPRNKDLKSLFQSTDPEWEMIQFDYSQAELRTAGVVAGVERIKELYNEGVDLHTNMAAAVAGIDSKDVTGSQRNAAKAINFGYLYGMQAKSFVDYAKLSYGQVFSLEEATDIRQKFFEEYKELPAYYQKYQSELLSTGFITSVMQRRYRVNFSDMYFPDERQKYMRRCINFPVQSAASDIVLAALIEIYETLPSNEVKICATVHDSIIVLVKKTSSFKNNVLTIQKIMERPKLMDKMLTVEWEVPMVADIEIGPWGKGIDLEEYMEVLDGEQ